MLTGDQQGAGGDHCPQPRCAAAVPVPYRHARAFLHRYHQRQAPGAHQCQGMGNISHGALRSPSGPHLTWLTELLSLHARHHRERTDVAPHCTPFLGVMMAGCQAREFLPARQDPQRRERLRAATLQARPCRLPQGRAGQCKT